MRHESCEEGARCRASVALLALLAVASMVPFLAGCSVTVTTQVPVKVNPFVGTWQATLGSVTYEYRFTSDSKYEYRSETTSGASTLTVTIAGTYEYDDSGNDRGTLSLEPSSTAIAAGQLQYEFTNREELKLTSSSAGGSVTVTLTYRRQ